jgi:hypothetical protein
LSVGAAGDFLIGVARGFFSDLRQAANMRVIVVGAGFETQIRTALPPRRARPTPSLLGDW